jgi:hypothetical protein
LSTEPHPELPDPNSAVDDEVFVYRLIPVWWCDVIEGKWEFQSGAFDNATPEHEHESPDDMSVVLGDTLAALARSPTHCRKTPPGQATSGASPR